MEVVYSHASFEDLRKIHDYIAQHSTNSAKRVVRTIQIV